jgi:hypothetical protein
MTTAFPLSWPQGWPRIPSHRQDSGAKFGRLSFAKARDSLLDELRRLHATHVVVSTNHPVDRNGIPREGTRIADHGVAVYFVLGGKPLVMACDRFTNAASNMRSVALAIEHLRGLQRHDSTMVERAFSGLRHCLHQQRGIGTCSAFLRAPKLTTLNEHFVAKR